MENNLFNIRLNGLANSQPKDFSNVFKTFNHLEGLDFKLKIAQAWIATTPNSLSIPSRILLTAIKVNEKPYSFDFWINSLNETKAKIVENLTILERFEHWSVAGAKTLAESYLELIEQMLESFIQFDDKVVATY